MYKLFTVILKASLFASLFSMVLGMYFISTEQYDTAMTCAIIGGLTNLVFTAIAISEVIVSRNLQTGTKLIWMAAFLLFQILAGVFYFLTERKSINQHLKIT